MLVSRKFRLFPFLFLVIIFGTSGCQFGRFVIYNFADINDHKKFQNRPIKADHESFTFEYADNGKYPKKVVGLNKKKIPFDAFLKQTNTVSFLIVRNDTIQYESYFHHYSDTSIIPSFSMSKSILSLLIGCAIDDGLITSEEEPIAKYLPEFKDKGVDKVTIKHLLQMTSGLKFNESYSNPFGDAAAFYYGRNLRKKTLKLDFNESPGKSFDYVSGNTQILGMLLERVLPSGNISSYLEEKVWKPLQMEFDASWSIDKKEDGIEKAFCCLNARARDYAKIGRLYANKGEWNGKQIVSEEWVTNSTKIDTTDASTSYYQYSWWIPSPYGDFMAEGILGQIIYVHPKKDLVIVRLGKDEGNTDWWGVMRNIADSY